MQPVDISEKCLGEFLKLIHHLTGITIAPHRSAMIEGRLRKRMTSLSIENYDDYLHLVQTHSVEQHKFIDLITTNETYFFRTPRIWEYIENKFLPVWHREHPQQVFLAWSAAASSGEEAHSLALVCQSFKDKNPSFLYQITGSDVSEEMISLCRQGLYTGKSIQSFRKTRGHLFAKYLKSSGDDVFQVVAEVRSRISFQQHNLFKPFPLKNNFDLVLVRNVLIYFSRPDQEIVLENIGHRLAQDGILIIGESESLSHIETPYQHIEPLVYGLKPNETQMKKVVSE